MKKHYFLFLLYLFGCVCTAQTTNIFDVARTGTVTQAETLLKQDPKSVNSKNAEGYTPLILACYRANNAVAKLLVQKGADVDALSGMGTALMAATVKGNSEMVTYLIGRKANPNLSDGNGKTAILYAVMFNKPDLASLLVKAGADAEHKDQQGQSALDYAILANDDKLIEILKTKKL
jgi:ankyrin repeat protein